MRERCEKKNIKKTLNRSLEWDGVSTWMFEWLEAARVARCGHISTYLLEVATFGGSPHRSLSLVDTCGHPWGRMTMKKSAQMAIETTHGGVSCIG